MKDHLNINSVNPFYLIVNEADGYSEQKMEIFNFCFNR